MMDSSGVASQAAMSGGIPISDLPEAAGKGLKNPERQSADCRGLLGSTGRFKSRCRSSDIERCLARGSRCKGYVSNACTPKNTRSR